MPRRPPPASTDPRSPRYASRKMTNEEMEELEQKRRDFRLALTQISQGVSPLPLDAQVQRIALAYVFAMDRLDEDIARRSEMYRRIETFLDDHRQTHTILRTKQFQGGE